MDMDMYWTFFFFFLLSSIIYYFLRSLLFYILHLYLLYILCLIQRCYCAVTLMSQSWGGSVVEELANNDHNGQYPPFHPNRTELNFFPDTYALIMSVSQNGTRGEPRS